MSEATATRALGWGFRDRTNQPLGESVIGRDPDSLLGADGAFESGDVVVYNYSSVDAGVDAVNGPTNTEAGVFSNVELLPAALPIEVGRAVRAAVVLPVNSRGSRRMRSTQEAASPLRGGQPGLRMRVASSGIVTVKIQIPTGTPIIRAGASLVLTPGERHLSVSSATGTRIVARLTHAVGPNDPFGTPYVGGEIIFADVEFFGEQGLGFDIAPGGSGVVVPGTQAAFDATNNQFSFNLGDWAVSTDGTLFEVTIPAASHGLSTVLLAEVWEETADSFIARDETGVRVDKATGDVVLSVPSSPSGLVFDGFVTLA